MNLDDIKGKIRKLLNLASDNTAAEGEIENAMRFAARLMDQHNLTEADLASREGASIREERMAQVMAFTHSKTVASWENSLASLVVELIGGIGCYIHHTASVAMTPHGTADLSDGEPRIARPVCFYGEEEKCRLAAELYNELRLTISTMARLRFGQVFRENGRSYCQGFVRGMYDRVQKDRSQATVELPAASASGSSTALAVITPAQRAIIKAENEKKIAVARKWLEETNDIRLRKGRRSTARVNTDAYGKGFADGQSHTITPRTPRRRLGGAS